MITSVLSCIIIIVATIVQPWKLTKYKGLTLVQPWKLKYKGLTLVQPWKSTKYKCLNLYSEAVYSVYRFCWSIYSTGMYLPCLPQLHLFDEISVASNEPALCFRVASLPMLLRTTTLSTQLLTP